MTETPKEVEKADLVGELSKEIIRFLNREEKKIRYEERCKRDELDKTISNLWTELRQKDNTIESLTKALEWKTEKENINVEIQKRLDQGEKEIAGALETKPPEDWHCPNVGNWSQAAEAEHHMIKYAEVQNPYRLGQELADLIRLVLRFEREIDAMHTNMRRYGKEILVSKVFGISPEATYQGTNFYPCPNGGRCTLPFIDKIVDKLPKQGLTEDIKPYPKIRIKEPNSTTLPSATEQV